MSAKEAFVQAVNSGISVADAARLHGVSRSCAYKWLERYVEEGVGGLEERSRVPEYSPKRTPQRIVNELLALKRRYPDFGPAKLVTVLEKKHKKHVVAPSTAGEILARHGLVVKRRSRASAAGRIEHPAFEIGGAGDTGTADFKGEFRMGNGRLCYPLTFADPFSRYVLAIHALTSTKVEGARVVFERVFREYGIPRQIVSDNGTPFCHSKALGGLTRLSRWWIELGITPIRIQPGQPQQNGIHERMHRTLKKWIRRRVAYDLRAHQRSFDEFRHEYNYVRPHQSLGQKTPSTAFQQYRPWSSRPKTLEYHTTMLVRSVRANGSMKWNSEDLFVSEVLAGANIGMLPIHEQLWAIFLGSVRIGYLDGQTRRAVNRLPERVKKDETLIE